MPNIILYIKQFHILSKSKSAKIKIIVIITTARNTNEGISERFQSNCLFKKNLEKKSL